MSILIHPQPNFLKDSFQKIRLGPEELATKGKFSGVFVDLVANN